MAGGVPERGVVGGRRVAAGAAAAAALVVVVAALVVVTHRDRGRPPTASAARPTAQATPARPALTAAEEAYAQAMWPLHREVENSALRMSVAGILFKSGDLDPTELHNRAGAALAVFEADRPRVEALQPPGSLRPQYSSYLGALQQYQQAASALLEVEGRDDGRLAQAAGLNQAASDVLREVGKKLWPGEYTPN
jgi:hypothetical protein